MTARGHSRAPQPYASVSTSRFTPIPSRSVSPTGKGSYYWGGAAGTWFWVDPVNDLAFIGMIQMQGGNRPDGLNFRADSAKLVYAALADPERRPPAARSSFAIAPPIFRLKPEATSDKQYRVASAFRRKSVARRAKCYSAVTGY